MRLRAPAERRGTSHMSAQPARALGALLAVPVPDLQNGEGLPLVLALSSPA
jgi:hypothetical protein